MTELSCNICKEVKELSEFPKRKDRPLGHYRYCKTCYNERKRRERKQRPEEYKKTRIEWIKKNPDKVSAAQRKWYYNNQEGKLEYKREWDRKNPERRLLRLAKERAKRNDLEFNIELSDVVIPEYCPVLGIKLKHGYDGKKTGIDTSPSIDRMNPKKGYIKGNIKIISYRANRMKWDSTIEDLEKILNYMKNG